MMLDWEAFLFSFFFLVAIFEVDGDLFKSEPSD